MNDQKTHETARDVNAHLLQRLVRRTPARLEALRYAAGLSQSYPTRSVSRALEKAGLIVWRIWRKGGFTLPFPSNDPQGWYITEKGEHFLKMWDSPNSNEHPPQRQPA